MIDMISRSLIHIVSALMLSCIEKEKPLEHSRSNGFLLVAQIGFEPMTLRV